MIVTMKNTQALTRMSTDNVPMHFAYFDMPEYISAVNGALFELVESVAKQKNIEHTLTEHSTDKEMREFLHKQGFTGYDIDHYIDKFFDKNNSIKVDAQFQAKLANLAAEMYNIIMEYSNIGDVEQYATTKLSDTGKIASVQIDMSMQSDNEESPLEPATLNVDIGSYNSKRIGLTIHTNNNGETFTVEED